MTPIGWLNSRVPGFANLSEEEKTSIQNFALLWSLFEGKVLDNQASSRRILSVVHDAVADGKMQMDSFQQCLNYFRERYFGPQGFTCHFGQLHLRSNDNVPLVEQVLSGNNNDPADCISVILIVIYRFRNNLFHGKKWEYELRGQLGNFTQANSALMTAYDQLLP